MLVLLPSIYQEDFNEEIALGTSFIFMDIWTNSTYLFPFQKLSSKYAFQRHQQWLQHAKTRSARHKIMKVCGTII